MAVNWQTVKDNAEQAALDISSTQRPQVVSYDGGSSTLFSIADAERLIALADKMLARAEVDASGSDISYVDT